VKVKAFDIVDSLKLQYLVVYSFGLLFVEFRVISPFRFQQLNEVCFFNRVINKRKVNVGKHESLLFFGTVWIHWQYHFVDHIHRANFGMVHKLLINFVFQLLAIDFIVEIGTRLQMLNLKHLIPVFDCQQLLLSCDPLQRVNLPSICSAILLSVFDPLSFFVNERSNEGPLAFMRSKLVETCFEKLFKLG
jgi:hypothetical protein